MTAEFVFATISFAVIQLLTIVGAYVQVQVRLKVLETRMQLTEKHLSHFDSTMDKLADQLHILTVELAKSRNSREE
jgi:uncharacterized coiled-coil protein SlyX